MTKAKILALATSFLLLGCSTEEHYQNLYESRTATRECPDWSSDPTHNYTNDDFSNLGCATTNNNYVQLKDKQDYSRGVGNVKINATRDGNILQNYYNGTGGAAASATGASSAASSSSR